MEQIKECAVKKVFIGDQSKDGKKFLDKNGKPYWKVAIMIDDETKYRSCLCFRRDDRAMSLQAGDKLILKLYASPSGEFLNFEVPSKKEIDFIELKGRVDAMEKIVSKLALSNNLEFAKSQKVGGMEGVEYPESDIRPEDIPF